MAGILTLENFRADSQTRSQRTLSDVPQLDRLINAAILDLLATDISFPELDKTQSVTMVVSQIAYPLPTGWYFYRKSGGRITGISGDTSKDDRKRLKPMTRTEYLGKTDYDTDTTPSHYHQYAGQLIIYPSPDKLFTVEIDHRVKPVTLIAGQVIEVGPEWDEAVTLATVARIYQQFQEHEKFLVANNNFVQYVRRRTAQEDQEKLSPTPLGVAWTESDIG